MSATIRLWPADLFRQTTLLISSLWTHGEFVPLNRLKEAPEGAQREQVAFLNEDAAIGSGHYILFAWDNELRSNAVWMYDAQGALVHRWPVDEAVIYEGETTGSSRPHPMEPLPDGSILVGFDALEAMARLDACGKPVWTKRGVHHHSFERAEDGGVWTWYGDHSAYSEYQYLVKFDPETGEEIKRIGLIEDVVTHSPEQATLLSLSTDDAFRGDLANPRDLFHPNDIEELPSAIADAFEQFEAGDLVLSLKTLDLILVMDQKGKIKWSQQGPWRQQHDPDFRPDGTISIFDNNRARTQSDILVIDPVSREIKSLFANWDVPFSTAHRGKHQYLPNGNILLTVPDQGQVLEVTPDRRVAVEFNNLWPRDASLNDDITNAKWVPDGFFERMPTCP